MGKSAKLEDLVRNSLRLLIVDGIWAVDDLYVTKMARMIEGKISQGESVRDAATSTVEFYATRRFDAGHAGLAEFVAKVEAWAAAPHEESSPSGAQREEVMRVIRALFEETYAGAYDGDWLDVDTHDFDLDAVAYLEAVATHFGVDMPPYLSNRALVDYVLARL